MTETEFVDWRQMTIQSWLNFLQQHYNNSDLLEPELVSRVTRPYKMSQTLDQFLVEKLLNLTTFLDRTKAIQNNVGLTPQLREYTTSKEHLKQFKIWWMSTVFKDVDNLGVPEVTKQMILSWKCLEADFTADELNRMRRYVACFQDIFKEIMHVKSSNVENTVGSS